MVYKRDRRTAYFVTVPTRTGRVKRSTGTTHRGTALAIEKMLDTLGPKGERAWDLLDRIEANTLMLGTLYDAWRFNRIAHLRDELRAADERRLEPDLRDHLESWRSWLADRVRNDTAEHYLAHVRTLIVTAAPFAVSSFTAPAIATWLASRTRLPQKRRPNATHSRRKEDAPARPVSGATRRKYLAAVQSFAGYLVEIGVLPTNVARDVKAPKAAKPRVVELDLGDVKRIVEGAEQPFRALFAVLYGAGVEISAALSCVESDVNAARRELRARGTKAHTRDRVVRIADWAWPFVEKHLKTLTPGERLFRGINRWTVGDVHRERLHALALPHHRVHDARHFYAVRAVRAGTPYELVARQLGHADVQMVARVYGKYAPTSDDRDRWEKIAAKLDADREAQKSKKIGEMGTAVGTSPEKQREPTTVSDWLADSRGGTRTHDPGIMSAVL